MVKLPLREVQVKKTCPGPATTRAQEWEARTGSMHLIIFGFLPAAGMRK